jgi:hypothetical protein
MTNYPWDDEIMAECRQRQAHVIQKYGGWKGLNQHLDDLKYVLEKDGWKYADQNKLYIKNLHRQISEESI